MNEKNARPPAEATPEHVSEGDVSRVIFILRGKRVILDSDLAVIYGVSTSQLNQAVRRNMERFPDDFLMTVTSDELSLISQFVISKAGRGGRRKPAWAFTEYGAFQACNVLNSRRAVAVSIFVVRAFTRMREYLLSNKELSRRLDELEARITSKLTTHDAAIATLIESMRELMNPPSRKQRPIGFTADLDGSS